MQYPLFKISNLSYSVEGKDILNSLSLDIWKGDFLSIIGPNGGGKTTLVKCLIQIIKSNSGSILLDNFPIGKIKTKDIAKRISYVPQVSENTFPFTAKEFLMLARYPHLSRFTSTRIEDNDAVAEAFRITETSQLADREMNTLSGGEKQMIFIAAALAQGGDVIVLDEPATFLDPKHEHNIYKILKKIHTQSNKTIISVTHNINSAILYSDRIAILKEGTIIFSGNSSEVTNGNILESTYGKDFTFIKHPNCEKHIILPEVIR
jgi:iron complex transport system ATP-binding protein